MTTTAILGCDVSLTSTGLAVVEFGARRPVLLDVRTVSTTPKLDMGSRLSLIRKGAMEIARDYGLKVAGIETGFVRHNKTSLLLAQARGVVLEGLHEAGVVDILDINNASAKYAVGAGGKFPTKEDGKAAVQHGVRKRISGASKTPMNNDEADACAITLAVWKLLRERPAAS